METASNPAQNSTGPIAGTTEPISSTGFSDRDSSTVTTPVRAVKEQPDPKEHGIPDRPAEGLWTPTPVNSLAGRASIGGRVYCSIQLGSIRTFVDEVDLIREYHGLRPDTRSAGLWCRPKKNQDSPVVEIGGVSYFCVLHGNWRVFLHVGDIQEAAERMGGAR